MLHYCIYQEERSSDNTSKLYTISSNIVFSCADAGWHRVHAHWNLYILMLCMWARIFLFFFVVFLLIWYVGLDNEIYHLRLLLMQDREKVERLKCNNTANPIQCTEKRLTLTLTSTNINLNTNLVIMVVQLLLLLFVVASQRCNSHLLTHSLSDWLCVYPPRFNVFCLHPLVYSLLLAIAPF